MCNQRLKNFRQEYIDIIIKELYGKALNDREAIMLFYWQNHKDEARFTFLNNFLDRFIKKHPYLKNKLI